MGSLDAYHGSAVREGQVSGQSGNSAPRRFKSITSPPDYPANTGIGITDFQNCCPATGKVRSIPTGTDGRKWRVSFRFLMPAVFPCADRAYGDLPG